MAPKKPWKPSLTNNKENYKRISIKVIFITHNDAISQEETKEEEQNELREVKTLTTS